MGSAGLGSRQADDAGSGPLRIPDIRSRLGTPARVAKPTRPSRGRPKGSVHRQAARYPFPAKAANKANKKPKTALNRLKRKLRASREINRSEHDDIGKARDGLETATMVANARARSCVLRLAGDIFTSFPQVQKGQAVCACRQRNPRRITDGGSVRCGNPASLSVTVMPPRRPDLSPCRLPRPGPYRRGTGTSRLGGSVCPRAASGAVWLIADGRCSLCLLSRPGCHSGWCGATRRSRTRACTCGRATSNSPMPCRARELRLSRPTFPALRRSTRQSVPSRTASG